MMDVEGLRIFLLVVRLGSFSAVAREAGIAPSSVSRAVDQLEAWLGVRVLQRSTRKLGLTEAGRVFFDRVTPLIEELERTQLEIKDLSNAVSGLMRITASPSFGTVCLAPALAKIEALYPDLRIDLNLSDRVVDLLEEKFDLAVRQGPLPDSNLVAERLLSSRYRVCASAGYTERWGKPEHPSELQKHRCLVFSLPVFRSRWKFKPNSGDVFEVPVNAVMQVNNGMVLRQWALAGAGIVMLSDWLIQADVDSHGLWDLFPDYECSATDFDSKVCLVYPSRDYVPNKVRVVASMLKHLLKAEFGYTT
jgi:DNA-binding transcriptional LysR family regulator